MAYEPIDYSDKIKITQVVIEFDNKRDRNTAKLALESKLTKTGRKNMLGNSIYTFKGTIETSFGLEQGVFTALSFNKVEKEDVIFFTKRSEHYRREYERNNGVSRLPPSQITSENSLKMIVEMNQPHEYRMERCLFQMIYNVGLPYEKQHDDMAVYNPRSKGSNSAYHAIKKLYL